MPPKLQVHISKYCHFIWITYGNSDTPGALSGVFPDNLTKFQTSVDDITICGPWNQQFDLPSLHNPMGNEPSPCGTPLSPVPHLRLTAVSPIRPRFTPLTSLPPVFASSPFATVLSERFFFPCKSDHVTPGLPSEFPEGEAVPCRCLCEKAPLKAREGHRSKTELGPSGVWCTAGRALALSKHTPIQGRHGCQAGG